MDAPDSARDPELDPRVHVARRIVRVIGAIVGVILVGASVLVGYSFVTERPAREMFFDPIEPEEPEEPAK